MTAVATNYGLPTQLSGSCNNIHCTTDTLCIAYMHSASRAKEKLSVGEEKYSVGEVKYSVGEVKLSVRLCCN